MGYRAADRRPLAVPKAKAPRTLQHTGALQGILQAATLYLPYLFMRSFLKSLKMFLRFTFAYNIRISYQLSRNAVGIIGDMEYWVEESLQNFQETLQELFTSIPERVL